MKKFLLAFGFIFLGISSAFADAGDIAVENIMNRVYDSTNTALKASIQGNAANLNNISADNLAVSADETGKTIFSVTSQDASTSIMVDKNNRIGLGTTPYLASKVIISSDVLSYDILTVVSRDGTVVLNVDRNKNVGIGTSTPLTKLEVIGAISGDFIRFDKQTASPDTTTLLGPVLAVSQDTDGTVNLNFYNGTVWQKVSLS